MMWQTQEQISNDLWTESGTVEAGGWSLQEMSDFD